MTKSSQKRVRKLKLGVDWFLLLLHHKPRVRLITQEQPFCTLVSY